MAQQPTASIRERLTAARIIPVLRFGSRREAEQAVECLLEAGFSTVEITLTTPDAVALIATLRKRLDETFLVGAGTVLELNQAKACVDAGAQYLVSPCLVPGMAALAHTAGRGALIGGFTPGEVLGAARAGADIVKVFPASTGGPSHIAALRAIYPEIALCPTGGVSVDNMLDYLKAGAALVGVGNSVIDRAALEAGNSRRVVQHARGFFDKLAEAR